MKGSGRQESGDFAANKPPPQVLRPAWCCNGAANSEADAAALALQHGGVSGCADGRLRLLAAPADVAQLVEHHSRKVGVPGSSPGVGFLSLREQGDRPGVEAGPSRDGVVFPFGKIDQRVADFLAKTPVREDFVTKCPIRLVSSRSGR